MIEMHIILKCMINYNVPKMQIKLFTIRNQELRIQITLNNDLERRHETETNTYIIMVKMTMYIYVHIILYNHVACCFDHTFLYTILHHAIIDQ